jgi:hypothetical protein
MNEVCVHSTWTVRRTHQSVVARSGSVMAILIRSESKSITDNQWSILFIPSVPVLGKMFNFLIQAVTGFASDLLLITLSYMP